MTIEALDPDTDRLLLLDRLAERLPELDLDREQIDWMPLDDGHQALLVNGGGIDGGSGAYFANAGEDVQAFGSFAPLARLGRLHRDPAGRQPLHRPRRAGPAGVAAFPRHQSWPAREEIRLPGIHIYE